MGDHTGWSPKHQPYSWKLQKGVIFIGVRLIELLDHLPGGGVLPWHSAYSSSQAHCDCCSRFLCCRNNPTEPWLTSCLMQLLPPAPRVSLLLLRTGHYGVCLVPTHSHQPTHLGPGGCRLQVQQGELLACTPPTS